MATYTDNFNRANETPLASPWVQDSVTGFSSALKLASNSVTGNGGAGMYHYGATFADDHYAKAKIINVGAGSIQYLPVRCSSGPSFYYARIAAGTTMRLAKCVAGTITTLVADASHSYAENDIIELRVVGNTLTLYQNGTPVSGMSYTDSSSPITSGCPGIGSASQGGWDDWEGGDVAAEEEGGGSPVYFLFSA